MSLKKLKPKEGETKLQRHVRRWLNSQGEDYERGWQGAFADLQQGGCISGIVSELTYYVDTLAFYKKHKSEINKLLSELMRDCDSKSPVEFLRNWDVADPLAHDTHNQNLLAWFGFEETANRIGADHGH